MKNFGRALLLLTLGLVLMSQAAMAQDALSAILPAPYTSRVGTQLMYYFEDGAVGARGNFKSFLTITNTNITTSVLVHFQFYALQNSTDNGCLELFDFVDVVTPGQRYIFDPANVRGTWYLGLVGFATDGRYIMTATPVNTGSPADLRAVAFNWLSGQIWVSDIGKSATYMTNAVSRMAVDVAGGPIADFTILEGVSYHLQYFRPQIISVNSFFRTAGAGAVAGGVPFGNRLTLFTWLDQYTNAQNMYRILPTRATLNSFVFDNAETPFSVPPRNVNCLTEYTLAPDTIGTSCNANGLCSNGNFADFLGSPLTSAVNNTGGWLRMRVASYGAVTHNLVGWFSQYLGTFGGGDYLIGQGRVQAGVNLVITTTNGAGVVVSSSATQPGP